MELLLSFKVHQVKAKVKEREESEWAVKKRMQALMLLAFFHNCNPNTATRPQLQQPFKSCVGAATSVQHLEVLALFPWNNHQWQCSGKITSKNNEATQEANMQERHAMLTQMLSPMRCL